MISTCDREKMSRRSRWLEEGAKCSQCLTVTVPALTRAYTCFQARLPRPVRTTRSNMSLMLDLHTKQFVHGWTAASVSTNETRGSEESSSSQLQVQGPYHLPDTPQKTRNFQRHMLPQAIVLLQGSISMVLLWTLTSLDDGWRTCVALSRRLVHDILLELESSRKKRNLCDIPSMTA